MKQQIIIVVNIFINERTLGRVIFVIDFNINFVCMPNIVHFNMNDPLSTHFGVDLLGHSEKRTKIIF